MTGFDIQYNGETGKSHGIRIVRRPSVPFPQKRVESYEIAGRDGSLILTDGTYDDIEISVEMNFMSARWMDTYREVNGWIARGGDGILKMSDDDEFFFKVRHAYLDGRSERLVKKIGKLTAVFVCDPYSYAVSGRLEHDPEEAAYNPFDASHPVYKIVGEGVCDLTVNGKTTRANVGQNLTIDTDLMIAYRQDGELLNTSVKGDYEGLYMEHGWNEIKVTEGFGLKVVPNWRRL